MRPYSDTFAAQQNQGFQVAQRISVYRDGNIQASTDASSNPLYIEQGTVEVDVAASFRRHLSGLKLIDPGGIWTPEEANDIFNVTSGAEIKVEVGQVVAGQPELFDQGWFGLQSSNIDDTPAGVVITMDGYDRARRISRNKFTKSYIVRSGKNVVDEVVNMWRDRAPDIDFHTIPNSHTTTYTVIDVQADPWEEGRKMLEAIGYEGFFRADGTCWIRPVPDPDDPDDYTLRWEFREGVNSTLLQTQRAQNNDTIYNGQIVTGISSYGLTPARAEVWDDNPRSPTYYLGPYGKVPNFTQSDKVSYNAQATDMAKGLLNKSKGLTETTSFGVLPHYALEDDDVVLVNRDVAGLQEVLLILATMTIPILSKGGGAGMALSARKRHV